MLQLGRFLAWCGCFFGFRCPLGVPRAYPDTTRAPIIPQLQHQRPYTPYTHPARTRRSTPSPFRGWGGSWRAVVVFLCFARALGVPQTHQNTVRVPRIPQLPYQRPFTRYVPGPAARRLMPPPCCSWGGSWRALIVILALYAPCECYGNTRTPRGCPRYPNCHTRGHLPGTYPHAHPARSDTRPGGPSTADCAHIFVLRSAFWHCPASLRCACLILPRLLSQRA